MRPPDACGKGGIDGKLDEADKRRHRLCACSDADCAKAVHEDFVAWKRSNGKTSDIKMTDEQSKRWDAIRDALHACQKKFDAAK